MCEDSHLSLGTWGAGRKVNMHVQVIRSSDNARHIPQLTETAYGEEDLGNVGPSLYRHLFIGCNFKVKC